jgi:hypothetical protein
MVLILHDLVWNFYTSSVKKGEGFAACMYVLVTGLITTGFRTTICNFVADRGTRAKPLGEGAQAGKGESEERPLGSV